MILLIDNYDSFAYNLYQYIGEICEAQGEEILVIRNDEMTVDAVDALCPSKIIISPGPGRPENAGIIVNLVQKLGKKYPILGVCLGHQAICQAFGANITYAKELMHGKQSEVEFDVSCALFRGCLPTSKVARYHSLVAEEGSLPAVLEVVACTADKEVMAVKHREYEIYGVQFHPESILTEDGMKMLRNFLVG